MSEKKADKVRARIVEVLDKHLFSERAYPTEIIIKTKYPTAEQTLVINFKDIQED